MKKGFRATKPKRRAKAAPQLSRSHRLETGAWKAGVPKSSGFTNGVDRSREDFGFNKIKYGSKSFKRGRDNGGGGMFHQRFQRRAKASRRDEEEKLVSRGDRVVLKQKGRTQEGGGRVS